MAELHKVNKARRQRDTVFSLIPKENATISVQARHFKTEPIETVAFSFGISENVLLTVYHNHLVDKGNIRRHRKI
jgi:hypothetical protein